MILIITSKQDAHIAAVSQHLDAAGVAWVRINTEDAATNIEITVSPADGSGTIRVGDSAKTVDLREIQAVWFRKPEAPILSHFALDAAALDYVEAEFTEILLGLYGLLHHVPWINDPFTTRIAHRKMLQLRVATEVGFRTPRTLITNNLEAALSFARSLPGDLAIKSLGAITVTQQSGDEAIQYGLFTRRVSLPELETVLDKVAYQPTAFQEFIEKRYELRITCVGDRCFPCRIEARTGDLTAEDYRFDTKGLNHVACECPELEGRLRAYMKFFGLNFGCFDIAITRDGEPVFFECNPNGQWLWVENMAGLPIGEGIATFLMRANG